MNPVTTALETIKAIQNETRGQVHAQAGSSLLLDSVLARSLSASSLACSDVSNGPTKSSEDREAVRQLNDGSISHPMAETEVTEGPTCSEQELRIDQQDRILIGSDRGLTRRTMVMISAGGSLVALLFSCGWIAGRIPGFFTAPASVQLNKVDSSAAPMSAASDRLALQPSSAKSKGSNRTHEVPKPGAQTVVLTTQQTNKPTPTAVERSKESIKPTPVPETRPTTIAGWTVRAVNGGTATLEGPNGVWKAARGDTVPGLGKIDSIVRWGNRWIVATSGGLVSTP
jgi:hypothetical protein